MLLDLSQPGARYELDASEAPLPLEQLHVLLADGSEQALPGFHDLPAVLEAGTVELQNREQAETDATIGRATQAMRKSEGGLECVPGFFCVATGRDNCDILATVCGGVYTESRGQAGGVSCTCK